jgi:Leucine-rich repeat (LRR) protein
MKDMKSRTNVDNKLSLILRIAIFLHSFSLSQSYVWSDTDTESSLGNRYREPLPQPLPQLRPQFVSKALPLTQSLSLSSLVKSNLAEALNAPPERRASSVQSSQSNGCSLLSKYPFCSCYALDDGLLIDCKITAIYQMTDVLNSLISQQIKSFSVYSINHTLNSLPERLFQNFSSIEQIYISLPSLVDVWAHTLVGLESSLKTLSIVNSKLKAVPKTALNKLKSLSALDLQSNAIREVESYAFDGLPLVSLNLQSNLINSLHEFSFGGLETTLVELVLIDNRLESFPLNAFQRLTSLEILKLQSNRISEIPDNGLTRLTALKSLDFQSNRLKQLKSDSFKTTPNLVSLSVANNELTVLSDSSVFNSMLDLENLDLSHNKLRNVYLNNLMTLRTVDLSNNQLEVIRFQDLPNLKEVFVSNNRIDRLTNETFINTSSLSVIFLQHNAIESIDYNTFHSLQHLLTLDLSSNQLRAINPLLLKHNIHLQSLYLDNNLISYIGLEAPTASNQELVRFLSLFYNFIDFYPILTSLLKTIELFVSFLKNKTQRSDNNSVCLMDCYAFDGLSELQVIDLSHNTIRTIPTRLFQSVSSLETLHLDNNWLSSIPNSLLRNSLFNLKTLTFNANPIVRIREDETSSYGFPGLEILTINDANITTIASNDFLGFPNLKILSLKNNGIQRLSPSALRPLRMLCELDLSANKLDILAEERLSGLVELKVLNVSNNNLSELPHFSPDLQALQTLDISYNRVTRIHSFGYLAQSMAYISVRHNMIAFIANNAFHNMTSLKTIDLRQNFLTQLSSQVFDAMQHNLQSILLSGMQ